MKAFDTDILTELLLGNPTYAERLAGVAPDEQMIPVVVIEEVVRGRLNAIRQAEAKKGRITIDQAYRLFEQTIVDLNSVQILPYSADAEALFNDWRAKRVKGSTHDLRIAASCVVSGSTLVTRNRRDFAQVPALSFEVWA